MTFRSCPCTATRSLVLLLAAVALLSTGAWVGGAWARRNVLGPTVPVVIAEAGLGFEARLDTGATVSSVNATDIEIVGGENLPPREHVGKLARFVLVNAAGVHARLEAPVAEVRGIQTSDCRELRYHIYLTVTHAGDSQRVLMNLNDRRGSPDKLLLGRNWLLRGYSVDVSRGARTPG